MLERCRAVVTQRRIHGALTVVWLVLAYPSVVYWRNSVPWLVGVSVYANVVGHWSAFEATKATEAAES